MPRLHSRLIATAVAGILTLVSVSAQTPADAARARTLFFQRDYESALAETTPKVASQPAGSELAAWHVLATARAGDEDDAVKAGRLMVSSAPMSGWSWLALAGALYYRGEDVAEAAEAGAKAFQLMPDSADAAWIHAQSMAGDDKRRQEAIAFIDGRRSRSAELVNVKGYILYSQSSSGRTRDEAKFKASLDAFDEAHKIDPNNVNALYLPGTYLTSLRRADEAIPLLKQAVTIAPGSTAVHQAYWRALNGSQKLTAEQKPAEIQADMTPFLQKHGSRAAVMYAASSMYGDLKNKDKQRELEEMVLSKFPGSMESEWIAAYRWRDLQQSNKEYAKDPAYRKLLADFVARPSHHHIGLLGEAYRDLFFVLVEDKAMTADQLRPILEGMVRCETTNVHIVHASALVSLADHKILLPEAEKLGRGSMDVLRKKVDSQRWAYETEGDYERGMNWMVSMGYDALGWVLNAEGKLDEAEQQLLMSYEMNHESRVNLHHLGKFYEAKGDTSRAEHYYVAGLSVQAPGVNPCETSLKDLYATKNPGNPGGFDKYIADIRDADRIKRNEKVLAERVKTPEPAPAFNLKTLDGTRVSLDSLKGKIVAINFWGIWCGWCIQELPDYQKLYDKYKNDPDIVILTIDNDHNPDDVPPWMKQKGYTFPVLLDDGFVAKAGITAFPTTWFLDREGRRVFVKVGWSEKLLEEFSWRLEAIR
jgi:tetratricopeptide (TPR) repeat protein